MSTKLIIQGLDKSNHLDEISSIFELDDFTKGIVSVAFIRSAGVHNVKTVFSKNAGRITVYAGVRNGITSAQAIRALLDIGVTVYLVDTGSVHRVFHPKLYFSRSKKKSKLLVGSANLTAGGLSANVEASIVVEQDHNVQAELELSNSIEEIFASMVKNHPANVTKVKAKTSLDDLLQDLRLIDERITRPPLAPAAGGNKAAPNTVMKLNTKKLQSIPKVASKKPAKVKKQAVVAPQPTPSIAMPAHYEVMWKMDGLTERDLVVPSGNNTAATGSINLDKGDLTGDYEWSYYFRDIVFYALDWSNPDARRNQTALGKFRIVVAGFDFGEFNLKVTHDTKTDTKSFRQKNAMTRLSWGKAHAFVGKRELIGRSLNLSRMIADHERFMIEID